PAARWSTVSATAIWATSTACRSWARCSKRLQSVEYGKAGRSTARLFRLAADEAAEQTREPRHAAALRADDVLELARTHGIEDHAGEFLDGIDRRSTG